MASNATSPQPGEQPAGGSAPARSAKPQRKRGAPFLSKRANGVYMFVRRYPQLYVKRGLFKQAAYRKSLSTRDRLVAEKAARQLAARFDRVLDALAARDERRGVVRPSRDVRLLLPADVEVVAKRFEALLLHSDDLDRDAGMTHEELSQYVDLAETQLRQVRDTFRRGDYGSFAEETQAFLSAEGLHCPPTGETWQALLKRMTQAQLSALRAVMERLDGDKHVDTPAPPPPVRSELDLDDLDMALAHWMKKTRPASKTIIEARSMHGRLKAFAGKSRISALDTPTLVRFQEAEARRLVRGRLIRPQSVNKMMGLLKAVFKLAFDDVLRASGIANPLQDLRKMRVKAADVIDRQDLSTEELQRLFMGPVHARGARPVGGAGEAAYWLPLLGLTTGARMREVGQLAVEDVVVRDGVTCLWLTSRNEDDEERGDAPAKRKRDKLWTRSLKTGESRRVIPVHPAVMALGFGDYVEHMRASGSSVLFPDLKPDCHGNLTGNFSKFFNRYLRTVGIKARGLDWVSFRHSLKTQMREVGIEQEVRDYLEGHVAERAAQKYGRFSPKKLLEEVGKLRFPALDKVCVWEAPQLEERP